MSSKIRRERFSFTASLTTAVLLFPLVFVLTGFVNRQILIRITDSSGFGIAGFPDWLFVLIVCIVMICLPILFAYLTSHIVYMNMRWKFINTDGRHCKIANTI